MLSPSPSSFLSLIPHLFLLVVIAALSTAPYCSATTLRIQIPSSNLLPNPHSLPASTHATLYSGNTSPWLRASLTRRSTLELHNLTDTVGPGSYLLDIYAKGYVFAPLRIDIGPAAAAFSVTGGEEMHDAAAASVMVIQGVWETYRGTLWSDRGLLLAASGSAGDGNSKEIVTVDAKVLAKQDFYEERAGFKPLNLLKNPMILLGIVAMGIVFGMPKLMENMDPEMRAEFEQQQKKGPMSQLNSAMQGQGGAGGASKFDLASFLAGASQAQTPTTQTPTTGAEVNADEVRPRRRG